MFSFGLPSIRVPAHSTHRHPGVAPGECGELPVPFRHFPERGADETLSDGEARAGSYLRAKKDWGAWVCGFCEGTFFLVFEENQQETYNCFFSFLGGWGVP